jgi:hypothetical protein
MPSRKTRNQQVPDLVPLNIIRQETVLSRLPIHRLSKKGLVDINIERKNEKGEVAFRWKVEPNPVHGAPGQLAYKLDTVVVNRRFDELGRPLPEYVRLGSLRDIGKELGLGSNTSKVTKALRQNSRTTIIAKLRYKDKDGNEQYFDFEDTRYGLVFTGQKFTTGPRTGEKADAVYLSLHPVYRHLLNTARVRPLDYDYLRDLPPAAQRFYELVSYPIYATFKYKHPHAKLLYSEYCLFSAQKRHFDYENFRVQMYKVYRSHLKSGYIQDARHQATTDSEGKLDWIMIYTPGKKARAEYRAFNKNQFLDEDMPVEDEFSREAFVPPQITNGHAADTSNHQMSEAEELLRYFHRRARGQERYQSPPGSRELELALELLEQHGAERARFIVDFAVDEAKTTRFRMRTFGALIQYVNEALGEWDRREQSRAQQRHYEALEEERRLQEDEERKRAVEQLEAFRRSSPEDYQTLFDEEKTKFLRWLPSAAKWPPHELEQNVRGAMILELARRQKKSPPTS